MRSFRTDALLTTTLILALAACTPQPAPQGGEPPTPDSAAQPSTDTVPTPLTELPRALSSAERAAVDANNHFAFSLLREVSGAEKRENVFLSPTSASLVLAMAMNGAAGETYAAMRDALGLERADTARINDAYRGLVGLLRGLDPAVTMRIANSVWYRQGFAFEPSFLETARRYYDAEVAGLDFSNPSALRTINAWVDSATNGRIEEIVERISPDDVMFLINAVYFKGTWVQAFDPKLTRNAPFTLANGNSIEVPVMHREGARIRHGSGEGFEVGELPYGRGAYAMTIVLPAEGQDIDAFVARLTPERWAEITATLQDATIDVALPKFRLEYERELNDALKALGMTPAFAPDRADFSRMAKSAPRKLYISAVKQKSYVDVDEQGTEAAAATSVGIRVTSLAPSFRVDRPFVVAIRERLSGTILFLGKVTDPRAGK
jgi:serpin B